MAHFNDSPQAYREQGIRLVEELLSGNSMLPRLRKHVPLTGFAALVAAEIVVKKRIVDRMLIQSIIKYVAAAVEELYWRFQIDPAVETAQFPDAQKTVAWIMNRARAIQREKKEIRTKQRTFAG